MKPIFKAALLLVCSFLAVQVNAEPADESESPSASHCTVRAGDSTTKILVCPKGLGMTDWRAAGFLACEGLSGCSAYIWDDPNRAPQRTPSPGEGLPKEYAASLVAIWVNDRQRLVIIRAVDKKH